MRLAWLRLWFLLTALVLGACQSPTLPLPPPNEPDYLNAPDGEQVEILGGPGTVLPEALVMIFNVDLGTGVIVTGGPRGELSARVDTDFSKTKSNTVEIWQRQGSGDSPSITKLIRDRR